MKKILLSLLSLGLVLLCIGCGSGGGGEPGSGGGGEPGSGGGNESFVDDFDQAAWEVGVTEDASYANFTTGTWWFRKMHEDYEGNKDYETGEFTVTSDIIGSDYDLSIGATKPEYFDSFTYTKIIEFDEDGDYYEYSQSELNWENSFKSKLYMLNRSSGGSIDKTKEEWQKATTIKANNEKTKFKSYAEEWYKSLDNPWGIAKTTYFFEKIN